MINLGNLHSFSRGEEGDEEEDEDEKEGGGSSSSRRRRRRRRATHADVRLPHVSLVVGVRSDGSIAVFVVLGAGVTQPERQ
jgi:hypothetical protein